jgi:hypothetical protein
MTSYSNIVIIGIAAAEKRGGDEEMRGDEKILIRR